VTYHVSGIVQHIFDGPPDSIQVGGQGRALAALRHVTFRVRREPRRSLRRCDARAATARTCHTHTHIFTRTRSRSHSTRSDKS
jgi:hypothetical protein